MTFLHLSLILSLLWVASLIYSQNKRRSILKWKDEPISTFIKYDKALQVGFVLLGLGLLSVGLHFKGFAIPVFGISGVGALLVMLTMKDINGRLHAAAAVTTYLLAIIGSIIYSPNPLLTGIAISNLLYALFAGIIKDEIGDFERYIALGLISWIGLTAFNVGS